MKKRIWENPFLILLHQKLIISKKIILMNMYCHYEKKNLEDNTKTLYQFLGYFLNKQEKLKNLVFNVKIYHDSTLVKAISMMEVEINHRAVIGTKFFR